MLDSETKRRIDTARDILVGKVPDPKSQVEQITIALVYKFMDDMDKQSIEMGGKASFFKGEFKKYSWTNIFDPRLGGVEMLNLYGEAITRMSQNENLPELFRNIFKNAFLPYRDPETLKLFLKTINEFTYDHSEKLGDAFEYLLSVLGSQGDAGQFRTPRHIIDFMVQVIGPKKNETVLDPACGTAGFLISAYKYIVESNSKDPKGLKRPLGSGLNAQDKKRIYENFKGYDISPDMVRLSLVNLYLHGFVTPQIYEYDSLTSDDRWNEYADVILANPPFMSPKGGIQPHKRFSVQSNRSEVLFVDYMAEHLTPNGRAAIIVPEGIIFQSAGAYKQLRKYLIEHNYLWAVVSLPQGMFNPYAGVKTSILFLDKALAKKTDKVLFLKVEQDGYELGAQRKALCSDNGDKPEFCPKHSDLPDVLSNLHTWRKAVVDGKPDSYHPTTASALLVSTSQFTDSNDYNLSANRYQEVVRSGKQTHEMISLASLFELSSKKVGNKTDIPVMSVTMNYGLIDQDEKFKRRIASKDIAGYKLVNRNEMVVGFPIDEGVIGFQQKYEAAAVSPAYDIWKLKREDVNLDFLETILRSDHARQLYRQRMRGTAGRRRTIEKKDFLAIEIPLPPLEIQRQIVDEIASHQRIIDGACQVVEGWKPDFEVELAELLPDGIDAWEKVKLGDQLSFVGSGVTPLGGKETYVDEGVLFIRSQNVLWGVCDFSDAAYIEKGVHEEMSRSQVKKNDVLLNITGASIGRSAVYIEDREANVNQHVTILRSNGNIEPNFLMNYLISKEGQDQIWSVQSGASRQALNYQQIKAMKIPLPPLEVQREIVARIARERSIVEGNRELIRIYEEKVKKVIERVWEG
ncbi:MAG: N-6 DNA methylase [Anaerolineales bacterium]|nr:N-6 DNA methylase [Anaerolineales bacterium]